MNSPKSAKISISLPGSLLDAVDAHCSIPKQERSNYFAALAEADLKARGKLPGTPENEVLVAAAAAARNHSPERVLAHLAQLNDAAYEAAAA